AKRSRSATLTIAYSTRLGGVKPNFGSRRWSGLWPPSKPSKCMLPERAFCPLPPRPAVLPSPEPWPRPTRFLSCREWYGALSECRLLMVDSFSLALRGGLGARGVAVANVTRLAARDLRLFLHVDRGDQVLHREDHSPNLG